MRHHYGKNSLKKSKRQHCLDQFKICQDPSRITNAKLAGSFMNKAIIESHCGLKPTGNRRWISSSGNRWVSKLLRKGTTTYKRRFSNFVLKLLQCVCVCFRQASLLLIEWWSIFLIERYRKIYQLILFYWRNFIFMSYLIYSINNT